MNQTEQLSRDILANLSDAQFLENLYRRDKAAFRLAFAAAAADMPAESARDFWQARLEKKQEALSWGKKTDWLLVALAGLTGGFILKIPSLFTLTEDNFFPRNLAFAFLPLLFVFLGKRSRLHSPGYLWAGVIFLVSVLYINLLPGKISGSDSLMLACLHLPVFLAGLLIFADGGGEIRQLKPRISFIQFGAEWLVMSALVLLSGLLFSGILLGLFDAIGYHIEKFYFNWIGIFGIAAIPVAAALLVKENPRLLRQVAPVVASIFSPLALLALLVYLPAMLFSGKSPFSDREFLLVFNLLLIGVLALIFFALPELGKNTAKKSGLLVLLGLSLLTLLVNAVAVSAILYRIFSWGLTANRSAVLGSNLLVFANLCLVAIDLYRALKNPAGEENAGNAIARFLPAYAVWAAFVAFALPLIFGFR